MSKHKFPSSIKTIEIEALKSGRFSFIKNPTLQENIAMKMQYLVFLLSLEEEFELPGAVTYSVFKTIIIFTASIVESLIHYKLEELIKSGKVEEKKIMGELKNFSINKKPYAISDNEKIFGIKETITTKQLKTDTNLRDLNIAACRAELFTKEIMEKAEKIRVARNRIHTFGLTGVDNKYTKKDIENIFEMARKVIERIEAF